MKRVKLRNAWLMLLAGASPLQAGEHLPGSSVPCDVVFRGAVGFVAVTVAEDEPMLGSIEGGARAVTQRFRLLGLAIGDTGDRPARSLSYRISGDGFERAVRKDERVIWLARLEADAWRGIHVLPDTPENRAEVYRHASGHFSPRGTDERGVHIEVERPLRSWRTDSPHDSS